MSSPFDHLLLFVAGTAAGSINVVAGGGSFLTMPALIFLGMPATLANGTNRVGIVMQNVGAVWGFHRHRVLEWRWAAIVGAPAVAGTVLGTWAALQVGDEAFQRTLAFLMVAITLWTLLGPGRSEPDPDAAPAPGWMLVAGFFVVGIYGGFVQAGVGFLILAVTTLGGLDLVRGNAVKVLCVLLYMPISLAGFAVGGKVDWVAGLVLGTGMLAGGQLGVRLTTRKGHRWVRAVVTVAIVIFAIRLWLTA